MCECANTYNPSLHILHTTQSSSLLVVPWGKNIAGSTISNFSIYICFHVMPLFSVKYFLPQLDMVSQSRNLLIQSHQKRLLAVERDRGIDLGDQLLLQQILNQFCHCSHHLQLLLPAVLDATNFLAFWRLSSIDMEASWFPLLPAQDSAFLTLNLLPVHLSFSIQMFVAVVFFPSWSL